MTAIRSRALSTLFLVIVLPSLATAHSRAPQGRTGTSGPVITSLPTVIDIGDNFTVAGTGFTPGSVLNFFVPTGSGTANFGPLEPASFLPDSLVVFVPTFVAQGLGVVDIQVVNTDQGHIVSNSALAFLQGEAAVGFPSLSAIDGVGLSPSSLDPGVALANVETVVKSGDTVTLSGSGFDVVNGVAVDLFCNCPGGKVGPIYLTPGNSGLKEGQLTFALPGGSGGPATGPGAFRVTNLGNFLASATVSVAVGAHITISNISQSGNTVTVTGDGFNGLTVINLFNLQGSAVANLGGLKSDGTPLVALRIVNSTQFGFTLPTGAVAGPAYIQALNPPFIPFTSSGNSPNGAFSLH